MWEETEGNPFFVGEVVRHLAESGAVVRRGDGWEITRWSDDLGIPEGVRDVVGRRLGRLSAASNKVLAVASVAGLEFSPVVVGRAGGFDEEEVIRALEQAVSARLLAEVPGSAMRYRFAHALVRATLYDELTALRRSALHRRLAEALEAVPAERAEDRLPALAHHWARGATTAESVTRAAVYAARAGDRALEQLAHDEAVTYYGQGLGLLDLAPDPAFALDLLVRLGEAQRRAGIPEHRGTLLRAARLARERDDADVHARAVLANQRGFVSLVGAIDDDRVEALEWAVAHTPPGGAPALRARLLALLANELHFSGDERPFGCATRPWPPPARRATRRPWRRCWPSPGM